MSGPFPAEIVGRLYAELQLRRDVVEFRCACKLWNVVAGEKSVKWDRWCKQRLSCAFAHNITGCSNCCHIGEFECEVCEEPESEALCYEDAQIACGRCQRRVGPKCCVAKVPVCVECVIECELGCEKKPARFIDKPWEFGDPCYDDLFYQCNDCDVVACYRCLYDKRDCFREQHEYICVSDMFGLRITNLHQ